jgi:ribonuclease HII
MEAGCDEAGRGCLAGPVYAAAVILPADYRHSLLNDSKKLNPKQRDLLRKEIENNAIDKAVAWCDASEIDQWNILQASLLAMHRALDKLTVKPELILVDGKHFRAWCQVPFKCMVKGDQIFSSIAAASILAKTYRDEFMVSLHERFPQYHWYSNKGYPTDSHVRAIKIHGLTPFHRKSFRWKQQSILLPD